jgi:hypothetical protein
MSIAGQDAGRAKGGIELA